MYWQARARHDVVNSAVAGCVTGGALAVKGKFLFVITVNEIQHNFTMDQFFAPKRIPLAAIIRDV